jgi:hypothetical protein
VQVGTQAQASATPTSASEPTRSPGSCSPAWVEHPPAISRPTPAAGRDGRNLDDELARLPPPEQEYAVARALLLRLVQLTSDWGIKREPWTAPFVKEQQSHAALLLVVLSGRLISDLRDAPSQRNRKRLSVRQTRAFLMARGPTGSTSSAVPARMRGRPRRPRGMESPGVSSAGRMLGLGLGSSTCLRKPAGTNGATSSVAAATARAMRAVAVATRKRAVLLHVSSCWLVFGALVITAAGDDGHREAEAG